MAGVVDALERALALRGSPIFASLRPEELLALADLTTSVAFAAGARLCAEGDKGDRAWILTGGRVRVERSSHPVAELGPPECVGELSILDGQPRSATVIALDHVTAIEILADDLLDVLADDPAAVRALAQTLANRLRA